MHFIFIYPFLATFLLAAEIKDSIKEHKHKKQWEKDAPIREAQEKAKREADIERQKQWKKDAPIREAQEAARREEAKITREPRYPEYLYCDECGKITKQCQAFLHNYSNRCLACNGGEYYENTCYFCDDGGSD